jgi:hypothetical protein
LKGSGRARALAFMSSEKIVVCGGGGFIGGHLVADLRRNGCTDIRSVDIKPIAEWSQVFPGAESRASDCATAWRRRTAGFTIRWRNRARTRGLRGAGESSLAMGMRPRKWSGVKVRPQINTDAHR